MTNKIQIALYDYYQSCRKAENMFLNNEIDSGELKRLFDINTRLYAIRIENIMNKGAYVRQ